MSYKPKYCCQCGEKIERIQLKPWNSRRFCELCETDYRIYDWLPYLSGIAILLTVFTINLYFQKSEKPLNIAPNQLMSGVTNGKGISANQNVAPVNANAVQIAAQTNGNASAVKFTTAKAADVKTIRTENSTAESLEKVYFCGAATKKGLPCSRRIKGGGRCWQHVGQPAVLAQEKLLAVQ